MMAMTTVIVHRLAVHGLAVHRLAAIRCAVVQAVTGVTGMASTRRHRPAHNAQCNYRALHHVDPPINLHATSNMIKDNRRPLVFPAGQWRVQRPAEPSGRAEMPAQLDPALAAASAGP